MNLGERIYHLRTRQHMSQSDFADALEVSRQSVSKWETNGSVPELEKLVRMSELFGITLDELIRGAKPEAPASEPPSPLPAARPGLPVRVITGFIFLGVGLVELILLSVLVEPLSALLLSLPLLACAAICLIFRRYPALWCGWVLYILLYAYLRWATGIRFWWIFNGWLYRDGLELHALIAWAMSLVPVALAAITVRLWAKARKQPKE